MLRLIRNTFYFLIIIGIFGCVLLFMYALKLEKEYHEKFKRILSVEKLYKYQEAEARFMREFMQERGHWHGGRHGGKP